MQMMSKWRVAVSFPGDREVEFWIHDNHLANVLRKAADIQFTENGLVQPSNINISLVAEKNPQLGVSTT
jgi:hypothetical protein